MSWGTELWDQYDNIASHTQKGIDFLERYGSFIDQRSKIEQEYATKLRRLVKTFLPKKKDEEEYQTFTCTKAYKTLLNELGDQAGQHEMIAETLSQTVAQELSSLVRQLKDDRRKHLTEGARIQAQLQTSLMLLQKTKEKYEKAFGASERALDAYQKADADLNLSRAEVEKQRMNSTHKSQQCDDCKNEYANQLQKTNEIQRNYFCHLLPSVFQNLQDLDEKRIKCFQNFVYKSVQAEKDVLPILSQCLDGIVKCADDIDDKKDSQLVIEKFKSGFTPPEDIPFEDLSDDTSVNGSMASIQLTATPNEKKTILGTITGGRVKKRSGILGLFSNQKGPLNNFNEKEDFSDLPPNQRRKKLQQKIDEITSKVCQETAARDGLMKMKQVYESNPALGDPMSIQGQLNENGQRLDKLRSELKKFQNYMDELEGRSPSSPAGMPLTRSSAPQPKNRRNSVSDQENGSLSRSASDSSVSNSTLKKNPQQSNNNGSEPIRKVTCRIFSPLTNKKKSEKDASVTSSASVTTSASVTASASVTTDASASVTKDAVKKSSSTSPESGIGVSSTSLPSSEQDDPGATADMDDDDDFYDAEPLPVLGRCKAMYTFEVTSEGSIPMEEGEDLWVIEQDEGDGWTRVRRINATPNDPMPEGFVPTSYVDIYELFPVPQSV